MKTKIPEELTADLPPSKWTKILTITPIVMTVIATMLAGLSSSEMTRAQYNRSLAAQLQSKAGDQWGYFQAKKLRAVVQRSTLDVLKNTSEIHTLGAAALETAGFKPTALADMDGVIATASQPPSLDANVKAALDALAQSKPETNIEDQLKSVDDATLETALQTANDRANAFDDSLQAVTPNFDKIETKVSATDKVLGRDFVAVRLTYTALRYDADARLNQTIAGIYELQVRKSDVEAERHRKRSGKFFYGMLAAQMGVIISTFALAARKRNWLWSVAAAAGLIAVTFAAYVYLCV